MYAVERAIFTHRCSRIRVRGCRTVPSERTRRIPPFVASRSHVFCVPFDGYSQRDDGATTVTTVYISCQYEQITVMQWWKKKRTRTSNRRKVHFGGWGTGDREQLRRTSRFFALATLMNVRHD